MTYSALSYHCSFLLGRSVWHLGLICWWPYNERTCGSRRLTLMALGRSSDIPICYIVTWTDILHCWLRMMVFLCIGWRIGVFRIVLVWWEWEKVLPKRQSQQNCRKPLWMKGLQLRVKTSIGGGWKMCLTKIVYSGNASTSRSIPNCVIAERLTMELLHNRYTLYMAAVVLIVSCKLSVILSICSYSVFVFLILYVWTLHNSTALVLHAGYKSVFIHHFVRKPLKCH